MIEFFTTNPWGIFLLIVFAVIILILLSAIFYKSFFKRFYDIVLSFIAIALLSPVLLILIVVGAIKMKGNPFFTQLRPGKIDKKTGEERIFRLIKFRSMTCEKDENGNLLPDNKRLTKYGKFLRSTSLDELPELFNIFIGNMSIVGPRPLVVKYLPYYTKEERKRHLVSPGLTGWAQVNGRNSIKWETKFKYDVEYVDSLSIWMDIKVVLYTFITVFKRSGIGVRNENDLIDFDVYRLNQRSE